jgi:hypothetical protein
MSYTKALQGIVNSYISAKEPWPATARQVAAWAIRTRVWAPEPTELIDQCADKLARAMREEYVTDPQGRNVRAKHAARFKADTGEQTTLWADIRTARPSHMRVAFQQRRQQIVGDCAQLKADVDSYNENTNQGQKIQLVLDFTLDVEEREKPDAA